MRHAITAVVLLTTTFGCDSKPEISTQVRPRDSVEDPLNIQDLKASLDHILAAILPHEGQAWFFKATTTAKTAEQIREPLKQFIKSVWFNKSGKPEWDLPDDWQLAAGDQFALVNIKIPTSEGLTNLSVTKLPLNEDRLEFLSVNVNRWLGQLSQQPVSKAIVKKLVKEIEAKEVRGSFVELVGVLPPERRAQMRQRRATVPSQPPQTPSAEKRPAAADQPNAPTTPSKAAATDLGFKFKAPDGWQQGPPRPMRKATFLVSGNDKATADKQAEIRISTFPNAAGMADPQINAQRWAGQVRLRASEDDLKQRIKPREIAGLPGHYMKLLADEPSEADRGTLAAMVVQGEQVWFFLLSGPRPVVEQQQESFEKFLDSVSFE